MLENMTTGEKALIGATAIGIAALVFHKPTRNAVGLSDGRNKRFVIYHDTYKSAIDEAIRWAENNGYEVSEKDITNEITFGQKRPSSGKSSKHSLELFKDGKLQKKNLQIQVFNDNGRYELNLYIL